MTKEQLLDDVDEYIRFGGGSPKLRRIIKKFEDSGSDEHFLIWLIDYHISENKNNKSYNVFCVGCNGDFVIKSPYEILSCEVECPYCQEIKVFKTKR
jgi:hypothetical protein